MKKITAAAIFLLGITTFSDAYALAPPTDGGNTAIKDKNIANLLNEIDVVVKFKQEGMNCTSLGVLSFDENKDQNELIGDIMYEISYIPVVDTNSNDCILEEDVCDMTITKANDSFSDINVGHLDASFSWSANKSGQYEIRYINIDRGDEPIESGYYKSGEKEITLDISKDLQHNYAYMAPLWEEAIKGNNLAFDLNSDEKVDVEDFSIFYKHWEEDARNKLIKVDVIDSSGCRGSEVWSVVPDLYMPIVSIQPRSTAIVDPIAITVSGTEYTECKINNGNYFDYEESFKVNPGDTVTCKGYNDETEGPEIIEYYPKKAQSTIKEMFKQLINVVSVNITALILKEY